MDGGGCSAPVRAGRLARVLDGLLGLVAAVLLFAMMALTFADVTGRYVFNNPVPGAFEMTEVAMGVLIFAGLPLISARDGHIAVNIADGLMSGRALRLRAFLLDLLIAACNGVLAWVLWEKGMQLVGYGDASPYLGIPIGPVMMAMAVLAWFTVLVLLVKACRSWIVFRRGGEA